MKKSAIIISILITAFVLGTVGGVVKAVSTSQTNAKVQELEQTIQAREQLYSQTIAEANARLTAANNELNGVGKILPTNSLIGPDQAIMNASAAVGSFGLTVSNTPELVNYNGVSAYEIKSADGTLLYIDSLTGGVLYNSLTGSAAKVITDQEAVLAAQDYMPGYQLSKVTQSVYNDQPVYIVEFTTGDQVFVNLAGQVVYVVQVQVQTAGNGSGGNNVSAASYSYDDDYEHENESGDDD